MSAEKKPNEIKLWKQFLNDEYQKMQKEIEGISDPKLRSELKDQLIWLKFQIKTFEEVNDIEAIQEDYEWVVNSFNHNLKPKDPFKRNP